MRKDSDKKILRYLLRTAVLSLIIAALAECFLFNYRFWESRGFCPEKVDVSQIRTEGLAVRADGTATVRGDGSEGVSADTSESTSKGTSKSTFKGTSEYTSKGTSGGASNNAGAESTGQSDAVWIEIPLGRETVKNVCLNPFAGDAEGAKLSGKPVSDGTSVAIVPSALDSTGTDAAALARTEIVNGIPESSYLRLHLNSNAAVLRITFPDLIPGDTLNLSGIVLNARRPFLLHPLRLLFLTLLGIVIGLFCPKSFLYQTELNLKSRRQKSAAALWMLVLMAGALLVGLVFYNRNWYSTDIQTSMQYNYVARALAKGQVWLDIEPAKALSEVSNPYIPSIRNAALQKAGETAYTDFAYYQGRYYSYFGVLPVILFFLPYYRITGKDLSTGLVILFLCLVFIAAAFWFVYTLMKKYFTRTSLGLYLLLTTAFLAGSQIIYALQMTSLYSLPLILGLLLDMIGITFWLKAADRDGTIHKSRLIAGSVFLALVLGCRPQLMLAVFLAFPIFRKEIRERLFFSRKGLWNTLSVILPFLPICFAFLLYNKARFGSLLDFGATYNLTGFDMTHRGFVPDRFWLGFYEYFFQPLTVGPTFPYIRMAAGHMGLVSDYQGQVINEPLLAGFFAVNPIALCLFGLEKYRKSLKSRNALSLSVLSLLSGILITAVDIQMVGMTLRYQMDFGIFLMIPVLLIIGSAYEGRIEARGEAGPVLRAAVFLTALTVLINCWGLLADGRYCSLAVSSPRVYYRIKYLLCGFLSIR